MTGDKKALDALPEGLLAWRGAMSDASKAVRRAGLSLLVIASISMVATQLNYVVVGNAHLMVVLAPIAICAYLYGTIPAVVTGALAGLAELIHATWLPLDYYEKYFVAPWNSLLLIALVGLVMGLLFALVDKRGPKAGWRRACAIAACCAVGSAFFTLYFHQSSYLINATLGIEVPAELHEQFAGSGVALGQFLGDWALMTCGALTAHWVNTRRGERSGELTLRETFQGWLAVVVSVAYLLCASLAYTGVSIICKGDAERQMTAEIAYLSEQLSSRDRMLEGLARRAPISQGVADEMHQVSILSVAEGFALGDDSVTIVAEDGVVVSANVDGYLGRSFVDVVGAGLRDGFDASIYDAKSSVEWNMGAGELGYARAAQIGYARMVRSGAYQILVAMSSDTVYHYRPLLMVVVSGVFIAIFGILYAQASLLLQNVVVRGFEETNEVLARITEGDLEQRVDVHDSVEFTQLSGGINSTVGALKDSIAEAEARIARELSTAKAIQESALPTTFPPFPEIERFGIYASMNAAREVGGDFYDFFLIDDHTLGFLIADVSGKGIPASLFMMASKTEIGNYMSSGMPLDQAIQSANYHLCQGNDAGMFVTVWAATLDYTTGELTYVNAGHNPPLLRHDGEWCWLRDRGGLFLGTFETATYRSRTITLNPSDQLLLYTDGVTEAFSASEEQFGEERLERFLVRHASDHPRDLVEGVRQEVGRWAEGAEQSDDITLLALEYGVAPEVSGSIVVPAQVEYLDRVLGLIHGELGRRLCPIATQNQIDIALEELFVNVCRYAYADAGEAGNVRVDYVYNANPSSITIQIVDQGVPFDPLTRKDPTKPTSIADAAIGGLGIFMAKKSVDDMSYLRDGNDNVLVFKKAW